MAAELEMGPVSMCEFMDKAEARVASARGEAIEVKQEVRSTTSAIF